MNPLEKLSRKKLEELAAEARIRGRSRMSKQELAEALAALGTTIREEPAHDVPASVPPPLPEAFPHSMTGPSGVILPQNLEEDRLCLLPQSPHRAFAYWEVGEERIAEALRKLGADSGRLLLRVHEGEVEGMTLAIEEVHHPIGSYHLKMERSGLQILAELGLEGRSGGYLTLLTSNRIALPRDEPSDEMGSLWMTRRKHFVETFHFPLGLGISGSPGIPGSLGGHAFPFISSWPAPSAGKKQ
jgi:hypothetical protein